MKAALALIAILWVSPAQAALNEVDVINQWIDAHLTCRGGSGDKPETWEACGKRDAYTQILQSLDYCYRRDLAERWAKCD